MWIDGALGSVASGFAYWGSAGSGIKLKVDQHNVMDAARIVMEEAERFRAMLSERREGLKVFPVGGDPVSREAARVLNLKFWNSEDSYLQRCVQYADMLENLARQLGESAKQYGNTEAEIEAMFGSAKAAADLA